MTLSMKVWRVNGNELEELPKTVLDQEERLEDWVAAEPTLLGLDVLIIGRQVRTGPGGFIDLLGIDQDGDLTIIELKRDRTPREVVAQILDYASWVSDLSRAEIERIAEGFMQESLSEAFIKRFDSGLPETINTDHKMVIVASTLDEASERITQYLASRHSININAIFFNFFHQDGVELLARSWLMDPEQVEERSETKRRAPWTGFYYVNVGDGKHRNWDDCRKYGFLSAGGGRQFSEALKKLDVGDPVFPYIKGRGYVGFGHVTQEAQPAENFVPEGQEKPLFDLPLVEPGMKEFSEDEENKEWVVGVRWNNAVNRDEARWFTGAFANQNIVCKLRDPATLAFLEKEFEVESGK